MRLRIFLFFLLLGICIPSTSRLKSGLPRKYKRDDLLTKELRIIEHKLLKLSLKEKKESAKKSSHKSQSHKASTPTYRCTGGKNPQTMDHAEYLREFIKGPCTPVIVAAGVSATKLIVEINCEELQKYGKAAFEACGWTSCAKSFLFFGSVPDKRYKLWIPEILSPMTLTNPFTDSGQKCFSALAGFSIERQSGRLHAVSPRGVYIYPEGDSYELAKYTECGWTALTDLLPVGDSLQSKLFEQYEALGNALKDDGYMMGLTAQALPYDWRLSIQENQFQEKFLKMLESMNEISGKKVSIIAHSFGNINTLYNLWRMGESKKQDLVQRYFALAPPFLGAPQMVQMLLGGTSAYYYKGFGLNFDTFRKVLGTYPSAFDLMPRDTFRLYKNEPWMISILNRIAKEEKTEQKIQPLKPEDDILENLFPDIDKVCFKNDWLYRSKMCLSGVHDYHIFGSVNGEPIKSDNLQEIINKYSYHSLAGEMYRDSKSEVFDRMPNPGVQTTIIYTNLLETAAEFYYNNDPKAVAASKPNSEFIDPDRIKSGVGDLSVLTTSAIVPGVKWAYEFEKKQTGAKPVIFVEVCSIQNQKTEVFQGSDISGAPSVSKNEYQGIDCECTRRGSESKCEHLGIVSDLHTVKYLLNSLQDNQKAKPNTTFQSLSPQAIKQFVENCDILLQ